MSRVCWFTAMFSLCAQTHARMFSGGVTRKRVNQELVTLCGVVTVSSPPFLLFLLSPLICRRWGERERWASFTFLLRVPILITRPQTYILSFFLLKKKIRKTKLRDKRSIPKNGDFDTRETNQSGKKGLRLTENVHVHYTSGVIRHKWD